MELSVVGGPDSQEALVKTVRAWCQKIARVLGLPLPRRAELILHPTGGVASTQGSTIHLYSGPQGPDLTHLPHELVHLIAGNCPSRFVSEGLAVWVADASGIGRPCWPCYGLGPDTWVAYFRSNKELPPLFDMVEQARLLSLAKLKPGNFESARRLYLAGGSFTGFLFRNTEATAFWERYRVGSFWSDSGELAAREERWLEVLPTVDQAENSLLAEAMDQMLREMRAVSGAGAE